MTMTPFDRAFGEAEAEGLHPVIKDATVHLLGHAGTLYRQGYLREARLREMVGILDEAFPGLAPVHGEFLATMLDMGVLDEADRL